MAIRAKQNNVRFYIYIQRSSPSICDWGARQKLKENVDCCAQCSSFIYMHKTVPHCISQHGQCCSIGVLYCCPLDKPSSVSACCQVWKTGDIVLGWGGGGTPYEMIKWFSGGASFWPHAWLQGMWILFLSLAWTLFHAGIAFTLLMLLSHSHVWK